MESSKNSKDNQFNKEEFWVKYSEVYKDVIEFDLIQISTVLYSQTRCWEATRILDAGCGSGRPSRMFVASYMRPGAHYNTDFSPKMLELFESGFKNLKMCDGEEIKLNALEKQDTHVVQTFNPDDATK